MHGFTRPGYRQVRGGVNGPSPPSITAEVNGEKLDLYNAGTIALQFGCTIKNVRAHAARGHYGPEHVVDGIKYYEKRIVDQFKPDPRGPKFGTDFTGD